MKYPPYLVYLGFALKVNCASIQFIHNKVTLKAINHSKNVGPILYECTLIFSAALFNRN